MGILRGAEGCTALIPVTRQPEPATFAPNVRNPGSAFLRRLRKRPTRDEFNRKNFWTRALPDLFSIYRSICAYSASWIPSAAQASVDHFHPKSRRPDLAYEWSNYRLATKEMNSNKGDATDILDPFALQLGWFILDMDSFHIKPNGGLPPSLVEAIRHTITVLKLNHDAYVTMRFEIVRDYSKADVTLDYIQRRFPFIASELVRQNLTTTIFGTMK